jgi:CysZ protein
MFAAASKAFAQLFTKPFRSVLLRSLALTIGLLAVLIVAIEAVFANLVTLPGWVETTIQVLGGLGLVVGSVFLVAPITSLIAALHLDDAAAEVERVHYPADPPGEELPLLASLGLSLKFGLVVIGVNVLVLLLLLLPGINLIAFYVANGYLLGREYFELAALRHLPLAEVHRLRHQHRARIFLSGLAVAGLVSIPIVNLLAPLFATALMVHTFKDVARLDARL